MAGGVPMRPHDGAVDLLKSFQPPWERWEFVRLQRVRLGPAATRGGIGGRGACSGIWTWRRGRRRSTRCRKRV